MNDYSLTSSLLLDVFFLFRTVEMGGKRDKCVSDERGWFLPKEIS